MIDARVPLFPYLELGWSAFWVLHRGRQVGFAASPLQVSEIAAFAELYDYTPGTRETEELVWTIQILDRELLEVWAEQRKKETPAKADSREVGRGRNRKSQ